MTQWAEGTKIGIPLGEAKNVANIQVYWDRVDWPLMTVLPGVWTTIDLANGPQWGVAGGPWQPNLPADIIGVFYSGELILTGVGDIWANFRAPGNVLPALNYQMHTIEADPLDGQRSNAAVWVPVVDRKFEFYWHYSSGSFAGINISLQAYAR